MGASRRRRLQALLWSVLLFLAVGLVAAAALDRGGGRRNGVPTPVSSAVELDSSRLHQFGEGRRTTARVRRQLGLMYVSKRRVPNGADPIHNRGEGKTARPPGRV